ncbi:hypothetical protein CIN_06130 [Commensalibacter intestini A911]|uniref:DUF1275 domain-containing protein n=2 Tax=Commensalibacter intestini TaxID=479936 RepID=G6EYU3_9PROT|nr:YoaK family protein [Commensalibacter intestini]EHD14681.1 hypothetical protein CIN_06130 [Commensalibacter intestini A911]
MLRHKTLLPIYIFLFTFIGGFADASSFLLSGIFTGHLTGNLVLCAVYTVQQNYFLLFHCICAVIGFISGTILGVWFRIEKKIQPSYKTSIALIFQLSVIILIFVIDLLFHTDTSHILFFTVLSFALGIQNGTINKLYKLGIHSSYVTGMTTTLINNYLTLEKTDPEYSNKIILYIIQFFIILFFVIGALTGALCIYLMNFMGFSALGLLLISSITLSIYIEHHHII